MSSTLPIQNLTFDEIEHVKGGLGPVAAYAIAVGLGGLFMAAYSAGYQFGKDLAGGDSLRQPNVKLK